MQNKVTDLNNHLFAQLERLGDESLTPEQLGQEVGRAKAITGIASTIIESNKVTVEAMKIMEKAGFDVGKAGNKLLSIEAKN